MAATSSIPETSTVSPSADGLNVLGARVGIDQTDSALSGDFQSLFQQMSDSLSPGESEDWDTFLSGLPDEILQTLTPEELAAFRTIYQNANNTLQNPAENVEDEEIVSSSLQNETIEGQEPIVLLDADPETFEIPEEEETEDLDTTLPWSEMGTQMEALLRQIVQLQPDWQDQIDAIVQELQGLSELSDPQATGQLQSVADQVDQLLADPTGMAEENAEMLGVLEGQIRELVGQDSNLLDRVSVSSLTEAPTFSLETELQSSISPFTEMRSEGDTQEIVTGEKMEQISEKKTSSPFSEFSQVSDSETSRKEASLSSGNASQTRVTQNANASQTSSLTKDVQPQAETTSNSLKGEDSSVHLPAKGSGLETSSVSSPSNSSSQQHGFQESLSDSTKETTSRLTEQMDRFQTVRQVTHRIKIMTQNGETRTVMRLDPPSLGHVEVEVESSTPGEMRVHMVVEDEGTKKILEASVGRLRESLEQQQIKLDRLEVQVDAGRADAQGGGQSAMQSRRRMSNSGNSRGTTFANVSIDIPSSDTGRRLGYNTMEIIA